MTGNSAHIVDVPFWDYMVRIVQVLVSLAVLFLAAYNVAFDDRAPNIVALFAGCWGVLILTYYNIGVHALPFIYNYIAVVITECLTVIFWAASFGSEAALYAANKDTGSFYTNIVTAIIALSAFLFILHVITFIIVAHGIKKHRANGHPLFSPQGRKATERANARAATTNVSAV
ncbi:Hypothetical protein R9X50_00157500 [Acrodontium crateriforme]|uniref:MARVEL domain-containing protein n=1 Tax=Acrodontium crateriforme TaxID=150365 RepID=A0AAQ3LZI9_9PEZI|nr:Hypothetical protein R9X50_00157500 [Acrodontium crateriforme]